MGFTSTVGIPFYGDSSGFSNLSNQQANQSIEVGREAARISDPFAPERGAYQNQLRNLISNPGEMTTSPYYQFALNQGLNALQRKGTVRSGNKLAELMKYGEGIASQGYFQQANLLSQLSGANTGSPGGAGIAFSGGYNRAQDQRQIAQSQRAFQPGSYGGGGGGFGLPSGGDTMGGLPYAGYDPYHGLSPGGGSYAGSAYPNSISPGGGYFTPDYADPYAGGGGGYDYGDYDVGGFVPDYVGGYNDYYSGGDYDTGGYDFGDYSGEY